MATTADDWTFIRSLLAITEEGNISVDLVAQALENLNIHLTGAETIPIDLVAQTIGNLAVDIQAAAIGNIPMNINEQGVGDILINIDAQNLDRLIIRPHEGGIESSALAFEVIDAATEHEFHSFSGKGALRYAIFHILSGTDSNKAMPTIEIDGTDIQPVASLEALNARGYNSNTRPIMLTKYELGGLCHLIWIFEPPIVFDVTLKLLCTNMSSANAISVSCTWFYQALPA